jgi:hypothetical protein
MLSHPFISSRSCTCAAPAVDEKDRHLSGRQASHRDDARFLLWSGLCFAFLAANNVVLYLDLAVFPEADLRLVRHGTALAGLVLLVWGLVWDAE